MVAKNQTDQDKWLLEDGLELRIEAGWREHAQGFVRVVLEDVHEGAV